MSEAAQRLVDGFGLAEEGVEPMCKAAIRLISSSAGFAEHVMGALAAAGEEPSPDKREEFCTKIAWGVYAQSAATGGIHGLDRDLPQEAFVDQTKRDKVAFEIMRHVSWRESVLAKWPGKSPAEILIEAFALQDPAAERLSRVIARILLVDDQFASAALDGARQEASLAPSERQSFLERFAATIYAQHGGRIDGVPGNLGRIAFSRLWIRDLIASALEARFAEPAKQAKVVAPVV